MQFRLKNVLCDPAASGSEDNCSTLKGSLSPHNVSALAGLAGLMQLGSTCSSAQHDVPIAPLPGGSVKVLFQAGHCPTLYRTDNLQLVLLGQPRQPMPVGSSLCCFGANSIQRVV